MVYSEVGAQRGSWKRPLLGFFETCGGCKAFVMACNWPFCGPCIFARISARVAWPKTTFSAFGDTPFLQWFRISLLLVCIYWACSWGEGVAAPTPKFNVIAGDLVDVRALDKLDDVGSTLAANATGDADIASEGKEIEDKIKAGMAKVDRYGEIKSLEFAESGELGPFHHMFATVKWAAGVVWLVLVILLRAHTRRQFAIAAECCQCRVSGDVDLEDILCSCCCQPCTVAQMATHTGAINNENTCDCCDMSDPGPCDQVLEALNGSGVASSEPPSSANAMDRADRV